MSYLPFLKKWQARPSPAARINMGHPIAQGLRGVWLLGEGRDVRNLVQGWPRSSASSVYTERAGKFGPGVIVGSGGIITDVADALNDFTAISYFEAFSTEPSAFARLFDKSYSSGFWLGHENSASSNYGGGVMESGSPYGRYVALQPGMPHQLVSIRLGATHYIVADGGRVSTSGTVTTSATGTQTLNIGAEFGGGSSSSLLLHHMCMLWRRALNPAEVAALWEDPFGLFVPPSGFRRYISLAGSGAQTVTGSSVIGSGESFPAGGLVVSDFITGSSPIASGESFPAGGVITGPVTGLSPIASGESFPSGGVVAGPITGTSPIASGESFSSAGSVADVFQTLTGSSPIASGESFPLGVVAGPITGASPIASGESVSSAGTIVHLIDGGTTIASGASVPSTGSLTAGVLGYDNIPSAEEFPRGGLVLRDDARTLFIRGRDRNAYLAVNTLNLVEEFNGRASATFDLNTYKRSIYRPNPDDEVIYCYGTDRLFGGFVQTVTEQALDSRSDLKIHVSCVDYRELADRRTYAKVYEGPTFDLATIVQEIFDATLAAEGITYDAAETGSVTGKRLVFDDETAATCLDRVCAVFGFNWRIDHCRQLKLERKSFDVAPRVIRDDDGVWRGMKVTRTNRQTRTRQGVRTSVPTGGQRTTTLAGNGTHQYLLSYSLLYAPKVVVNTVQKTVIAYEDRGSAPWDFAWERTSNVLYHNPAQTAYTSSDSIVVTHASSSL